VPVGLKDLIDTKDVRTTAGSALWRDRVPSVDAVVWSRLQQAGAILLGKHNMHEFAYGTTNENIHYGTVINPWGSGRTAGGSSGGSAAAVAADLSPFSMGTDTGGSIRIPAAFTGLYGLKPTYGLVSLEGVTPLATTLDPAGPLARSTRYVALLLRIITGLDPVDNTAVATSSASPERPLAGLRVGYEESFFKASVDAELLAGLRAALTQCERAGAELYAVRVDSIARVPEWQNITITSEAFAFHQRDLDNPQAPYGPDTRLRLETGRAILAADYVRAQTGRQRFRRSLDEVFEQVDVLLTPTVQFVPPPLAERSIRVNGTAVEYRKFLTRLTNPFNLSGHPALSVPYGLSMLGLPLSVQIVGRPFAEAVLLHLASVLEEERPFQAPPACVP